MLDGSYLNLQEKILQKLEINFKKVIKEITDVWLVILCCSNINKWIIFNKFISNYQIKSTEIDA